VGSEDYEIRVFQNEEVISELTETDKVVGLCPLKGAAPSPPFQAAEPVFRV
jgi:Bardet-Biedl syndrome 2 protein